MPEDRPASARILFRADGNAEIGSGHLRRCLSLAEQLRSWGHECVFVCAAAERSFNRLVGDAGFQLIELAPPEGSERSAQRDAEEVIAAVGACGPFDVAVVDHYRLDRPWQREIRSIAGRIAVIDDLADRPHDCDLLLDPAPGDSQRYAGLVPPSCLTLLGPRYALLRPEFAELRKRGSERSGTVERVLISFGGADADNFTGRAIDAVRSALPAARIDATSSRAAPHREQLEELARADANLSLHVDAANMGELMAAADLAVGAGGSTSWERACLGLPSIVAVVADNQQDTVRALEALGCAIAVGAEAAFGVELERLVACLATSPGLLRLMSSAGAAVVDGRGAARVASLLCPPAVTVRPAQPDDARRVWEWRNAPEIRATALSPEEIAWEAHSAWFARRLEDPRTVMLIGEDGGEAIGVVRFDLDGGDATVSIFLAPARAGRGRGRALLQAGEQWIERRHPGVSRFLAEVLEGNSGSISLFRSAAYSLRALRFERTAH